jgi:hypothetical protein
VCLISCDLEGLCVCLIVCDLETSTMKSPNTIQTVAPLKMKHLSSTSKSAD